MLAAAIATGVVELVVSAADLAGAIHRLLAARDLLRDARVRDQPFDVSAA
jgi:hypothetical protein